MPTSPTTTERTNFSRDFFEGASDAQLDYFPAKYMRGLIDEMDHQVSVLADSDPHALESVDPARIMRRGEAMRPLLDWRSEKENAGRFSWTLGLYGTPAMASRGRAEHRGVLGADRPRLFLDMEDPIARWREIGQRLDETRERLDALDIERVHVLGEDVDLWVSVGEQRRWLGGRGRNIPSFEIFTSPDWRGTEGWIRFNQPLYRYGNLVKGIRLEFADGCVTQASADENERILTEMIATEGADKVGEFSLTDKRFSRITRFMAHTLYDENVGGPFGNTDIALGTLLPGRLRRRSLSGQERGVASTWLQQLERAHRHRLHQRPGRHSPVARRRGARDLSRRGVSARAGAPIGLTSTVCLCVYSIGRIIS